MRFGKEEFKLVNSIDAVTAKTADANGTGVDTLGFHSGVMVVWAQDIDVADADEVYTIEIEESDDNSVWSDLGTSFDATVSADGDILYVNIPDLNTTRKRYLRAVLNVSGTTPSFEGAVFFALGDAQAGPVNS